MKTTVQYLWHDVKCLVSVLWQVGLLLVVAFGPGVLASVNKQPWYAAIYISYFVVAYVCHFIYRKKQDMAKETE